MRAANRPIKNSHIASPRPIKTGTSAEHYKNMYTHINEKKTQNTEKKHTH